MKRKEILRWLREPNPAELMSLYRHADTVRRTNMEEAVYLNGLIEISNNCQRECAYCGLRSGRTNLKRFRMTENEVVACARKAVLFGCSGVMLQGGDDPELTREWVADVVRRVKAETPLAITISLGERPEKDLRAWREAGAERYMLRFETSDAELFQRIHPSLSEKRVNRLGTLKKLADCGFKVGSGSMIGIPGQSYESVARDIELLTELHLDMIGSGPYLPHPDTPIGSGQMVQVLPPGEQIPASEDIVYRLTALLRRLNPRVHIPVTAALATLNPNNGRELGLMRGANMVLTNLTPLKYRKLYEVYPNRICLREPADGASEALRGRIRSIGRRVAASSATKPRVSNIPTLLL